MRIHYEWFWPIYATIALYEDLCLEAICSPTIAAKSNKWTRRTPNGDITFPSFPDIIQAKNLKVGNKSLWTLADRNTNVNGIPKAAKNVQNNFPPGVKGTMWPYPEKLIIKDT